MILTDKESIEFYSNTGAWGTKTLVEVFQENVQRHPNRTALIDPINKEALVGSAPEQISYSDLEKRVDALATAFIAKGITKDDIVVIQLPNIWELTLVYMALARIGAIFSPLPMQWRKKEFEYISDLTKAKVYICAEEFAGFNHVKMAEELKPKLPSLEKILTLTEIISLSNGPTDLKALDAIKIDANDVFSLCWSSGTESNSKGCPMSHNNWLSQINVLSRAFGTWEDRCQEILCAAPMVNMTGVCVGLLNWLSTAGTTTFHHPFDGEVFFKQMMAGNITSTLLVPTLLNTILKHPAVDQFNLDSVEKIMTGSAPPSAWALDQFKKRWNIDISCAWGQTEGTGILSSAEDVPDPEKRARFYPNWSVRRDESPAQGVEIKIVDTSSSETMTEIGSVGQLAYKGPNVFPGYFRRPDLSESSFDKDGYFYTGDLFRIEEDGYVSFFDRCKDIIIRGGNNISAQEIENMLQGHPAVLDVAAVAMPDERLGEKICIYVVPKDTDNAPDLSDLTGFMTEQGLAIYKLPERLEFIDAIPRNPVGKIVKPELRKNIADKIKAEA